MTRGSRCRSGRQRCCSRTLCLDVGAVDGGTLRHGSGLGQRIEQLYPEAPARPAVEAIVDCRRGAVVGRAVAPTAADLQDMQDARDHPPIVHPAGTGLVLRQGSEEHTSELQSLMRISYAVFCLKKKNKQTT